jgi:hypothetical protein
VYYAINAAFAGLTSPGYVPADGAQVVGPLSNLNTLHIYGVAGSVAHIQFFREA